VRRLVDWIKIARRYTYHICNNSKTHTSARHDCREGEDGTPWNQLLRNSNPLSEYSTSLPTELHMRMRGLYGNSTFGRTHVYLPAYPSSGSIATHRRIGTTPACSVCFLMSDGWRRWRGTKLIFRTAVPAPTLNSTLKTIKKGKAGILRVGVASEY